jgi:hypothetical protein
LKAWIRFAGLTASAGKGSAEPMRRIVQIDKSILPLSLLKLACVERGEL